MTRHADGRRRTESPHGAGTTPHYDRPGGATERDGAISCCVRRGDARFCESCQRQVTDSSSRPSRNASPRGEPTPTPVGRGDPSGRTLAPPHSRAKTGSPRRGFVRFGDESYRTPGRGRFEPVTRGIAPDRRVRPIGAERRPLRTRSWRGCDRQPLGLGRVAPDPSTFPSAFLRCR